jgi:hypothetical protein
VLLLEDEELLLELEVEELEELVLLEEVLDPVVEVLLEELEELEEDELELLLEVPPSPVQDGPEKLPSCVP